MKTIPNIRFPLTAVLLYTSNSLTDFMSYSSFRAPGIVFGIAKDGELILKGGIGYADVENGILCNSSTVMRIASISKSLTSIAVGKS